MVEVVNMRTCDPPWGQPGDVRIDRATKWGNPHRILTSDKLGRERQMVCIMYETDFALSGLDISELAHAKRLGCWCKPKRCHGDFLKKKIENYLAKQQRTLI